MAHRVQRIVGHVLVGSHTSPIVSRSGTIITQPTHAANLNTSRNARFCVVTGAASGIGRATVLRLEELGWHILAVDFNEELLKDLDTATSDRVEILPCDLSTPDACNEVKQRAENMISKFGLDGLAGLANIAGRMQGSPAACVEDKEMRDLISINCEAPVRLTRLLMPLLLKTQSPRICNVASITAELAFPWGGIYSATKGFISNFSDSLRREARANRLPLQVSVVKPGFIDTPMTSSLARQQLQWCETHPDDPFSPALHKSATRNEFVRINGRLPGSLGGMLATLMGDPQKPMRNSPQDVAAQIVHALTSDSPLQRYFTGTLVFKGIINFAHLLPAHLRDGFLMQLL